MKMHALFRGFLLAALLATGQASAQTISYTGGGGGAPSGAAGGVLAGTYPNPSFAPSPVFVTPTIGVASGTSLSLLGGAAGTPSLTINDTDSGMYSSAAGTLNWSTNGVLRFLLGPGDGTPTANGTLGLRILGTTLNDSATAGSGTAANFMVSSVGQPTLTATNASITTTEAGTFRIGGAPLCSTNETCASIYGLFVDNGSALTNTSHGYGLYSRAPTGATNNWAGGFAQTTANIDQVVFKSLRTGIGSADVIGGLAFESDDSTLTAPGAVTAQFRARATETHTGSAQGTEFAWRLIPNTTATIADAMTLSGAGLLTLPLSGGGLTVAGPETSSYTSVASTPAELFSGTWFTGGSATTTKPHLLIEPAGTTSNTWSTSGTGIGVNAASGFGGNLIDLRIAAVSVFRINGSGGGITTITSPSANAFQSGPNGATNPTFQLDQSVASAATGVKITGRAAGTAPTIAANSPNTNEDLDVRGQGTGLVHLGARVTCTATAGAATCNGQHGAVTSESLTTAASAAYTLTITNSSVATTSDCFASVDNGSNTTDTFAVERISPTSGSLVVRVRNTGTITALNGTLVVHFQCM